MQACPDLRKIHIQSAIDLSNEAVLVFLQYCPNLTRLEITGCWEGEEVAWIAKLSAILPQHPEWTPKLDILHLARQPKDNEYPFRETARHISNIREGLLIEIVLVYEELWRGFGRVWRWRACQVEEASKRMYTRSSMVWLKVVALGRWPVSWQDQASILWHARWWRREA